MTTPLDVASGGGLLLRSDLDAAGTGVPVIFVHGMAGSREVWRGARAHLRGARPTAAFDLRGHGQSTGAEIPRSRWTIEELADDVDAVARNAGFSRFVLVGHSMAGQVLCAYAGAHPGKVAGLFFVDPVGELWRSGESEIRAWAAMMEKMEPKALAERFVLKLGHGRISQSTKALIEADVLRQAPAARALFHAMAAFRAVEPLSRYTGPMFTLDVPDNAGEGSLWKLDRRIEREVVESSHWIMLDNPAEFERALDRFLATVDPK